MEAWREDGATSMTDWVMYRRGLSRLSAADHVRVAGALPDLPRIDESFTSGRLSWDKVTLITTVATPQDEAWWASMAETSTVAYLETLVRHRRRLHRSDAEDQISRRFLDLRWDEHNGVLRLSGRLPGPDGAVVKNAIELLAEQAPRHPIDDSYLPFRHRCADALVDLASARVSNDADRATVVVHVDARELNAVHGLATLQDGPPIAAEAARRMSCDGRVQLVADAASGEPVGVGRTTRVVPPWLARQIRNRDGGCTFLGCGRTRGLQMHHVIHWAHGGPTDIDNLVALCRYHHRLVHEGKFRMIKDSAGRCRVVRRNGRPLPLRPASIRPEVRERLFGPPAPRPHARC
jgi:hypothetical protein